MSKPEPPPPEHRGRGGSLSHKPPPLDPRDDVIKLRCCPDCRGRGWFLIEPFKTGSTNGAGGLGNMCQCLTCKASYRHYKLHGELPAWLVEEVGTIDKHGEPLNKG